MKIIVILCMYENDTMKPTKNCQKGGEGRRGKKKEQYK
jgi:hypothetical protein